MHEFVRAVDWYLNMYLGDPERLVISPQNSSAAPRPTWISGDRFKLRIHPRIKTGAQVGSGTVAVSLPEGSAILVGAKAENLLHQAGLLFFADNFVLHDGEDPYWEAIINLNTIAVVNGFSGAPTFNAFVDVEIQNADNSERLTYQVPITLRRQAYAGEPAPDPEDPQWPAPQSLALKAPEDSNYRIAGNVFRLRETGPVAGWREWWSVNGVLQPGSLIPDEE